MRLDGRQIRGQRLSRRQSPPQFLDCLTRRVQQSGDRILLDWLDRCSANGLLCPIPVSTLLDIEEGRAGHQEFLAVRFFAVGLGLEWRKLVGCHGRGDPEGLPEKGAALLPMATVLSRDVVHEGPGGRAAVELDEIVAVRRSDGSALVLGYGSVAEEALYLLIDGYAGGGFAAVMLWAGVQPESGFSYDPELGLLVGPKERPRLVVGRSGCRVRLAFETGRNDASADIAGFAWWGPSEG